MKEAKHFEVGGESGSRTHEGVTPLLDFESSSFSHSDISPQGERIL